MSSSANTSLADQQAQSGGSSGSVLQTGDGLLPQYFDSYQIVDRLGGGAMATVYRAVDTESNQPVALKVLAPGADDILRERFRTEARTVSVLAHPHIVQTLRVGQVQNAFPYIAMELVEGDSLASLLERQNQLSVADTCLLLEPIARALSYAHSHHVIHRDVKPSNILLRHAQPGAPHSIQLAALGIPVIPLLSDFGIARALDAPELTTVGRTIGTPAYMSPEQCAGTRNLDGRADIYSLATVLYRCLVGRPPFMGATTQILHAHVYEALTIPDAIAQALPPAMLSILQRALQKNPEERYADMTLFANDLSALLHHMRIPHNGVQEATLTLPLLTALQPEQEKKTNRLLVAGVTEQNLRLPDGDRTEAEAQNIELANRNPLTGLRTTQSNATVAPRPQTETASANRPRPATRPTNWVYVTVASLLSVALFALLLIGLVSYLPDLGFGDGTNGNPAAVVISPTATPSAAIDGTPASSVADNSAAIATTTVATAVLPSGADGTPNSSPAAVVTRDGATMVTGTATLTSTSSLTTGATTTATNSLTGTVSLTGTAAMTAAIAYDIGSIWQEDVLFFYRERDWRKTRRGVLDVFGGALQQEANIAFNDLLLLSPSKQAELIADKLLKNRTAGFWQEWQVTIPPNQVEQVLFDTYVGIANQENKARQPAAALAYFDAALFIREDEDTIKKLSAATARYANAIGSTPTALAADALRDLYKDYAAAAAAEQAFCSAAEYLSVAAEIAQDRSVYAADLQSYEQQCATRAVTATPVQTVAPQNSTFIYSTEDSGIYQIYRAFANGENHSWELLVENGAQPGVSPDGRYVAFYSRRSDSQGISLLDMNATLTPPSIFPRLSNFIEDSRLSPPSWSPESNRLAFASDRESDRKLRIYVSVPPDRAFSTFYDFGEDPAWGPQLGGQFWIAYKGADDSGNNLGLWLISENKEKQPLTRNGSDRRPAWSPDGQYVVFMRDVGNGNWELFRVRVADGSELQLTNNPAQDGLPTISPDGRWVAFATDRSGVWEIWQVALDGSSEQLVMPMQGVLRDWLEHAIQWVK